ncbi:Mobile element protein [Candidatus Enterovibrio altilux]|uniref:Mobile element protein n=1 Tax=Candidatus Enterovibrio altilux TaxID=1927128 RepID=A0A291BAH9_9GAMM|nr:Mobile element protein [Candidatus Enterovibrio luxaltus]
MKNKRTIQHLTLDSTVLNVYGKGEGKVKKHGSGEKQRIWTKLHLEININTYEIIATA